MFLIAMISRSSSAQKVTVSKLGSTYYDEGSDDAAMELDITERGTEEDNVRDYDNRKNDVLMERDNAIVDYNSDASGTDAGA